MQNNKPEILGVPRRGKYVIAGIKTGMILRDGWTTEKQSRAYSCDFDGEPEITLGFEDEYIIERNREFPSLSLDDCEYMYTGSEFCTRLLDFDGFMLHASAIVVNDRAYLFSAPSGTGKSTHTSLWLEAFGKDGAYILNDDKPVIRIVDGEIRVFGTPWSGKTDQNRNADVLLGGICFLERSSENWIREVRTKDALYGILNQTIRPDNEKEMTKLLEILDKALKDIKAWQMGCNRSKDAAIMAFDAMKGENPR